MAPPKKVSTSPDAPPQDDPADVGAVAVRSDHWNSIIDFLSVQSLVLNAAVPGHIYGLQAEAHRKYKVLEPMLNKYKFPEDLVEVTVTLDNGEQQKVRISQRALTAGVNLTGGSKENGTVEDEKTIETKSDAIDGNAAQITTKQHSKSIETPKASSSNQTGSSTVGSSSTHSSQQSNTSKPATNKPTASASQATAKSSEESSRRAASKPEQKAACVVSSDKPQVIANTPVTKSDMRKILDKPNRVRVIPPKNMNPFGIAQAQEPEFATCKTPKNSNTPEPVAKSETFTFVKNGSREQKSFVHPDTPPKPTESVARKTYSEAASSPDRKSDDAGLKVDVDPYAVLKDKTNKGKAETKASAKTSTESKTTKPIIKQKATTADDKLLAMDSKPATAKRPHSNTHTNERPTKKLVTKQTRALDIDIGRQTEAKCDEETSPGSLSSPTEAEKAPARSSTPDVDTKLGSSRTEEAFAASVATTDSRELEQNEAAPNSGPSNASVEDSSKSTTSIKPDEAPASARAKDASTKQEVKTSETSRRTPRSTPGSPEERKGVAKVVKKAPKRARDRADDFIKDTSDEDDAKPKRKAKKVKRDEGNSQRESLTGYEENDEDSTCAPRKPRAVKKSRTISSSHVKSTESRSSEEDDKKYTNDKSLAKENKQNGLVLDEARQRRTPSSEPSTSSTSLSPPRPTDSSKLTETPNPSSTSRRSEASSATPSPRPTTATSASTISAPVKRKQDDSSTDGQPPKKQTVSQRAKILATTTLRASGEERLSAEAKMKKLIEQRTGQPSIDYFAMKRQPKEE